MSGVYDGAWHEAEVYDPTEVLTGRMRASFTVKPPPGAPLPMSQRGVASVTGVAELLEGELPQTEWFTLRFADGLQGRFFAEWVSGRRFRLMPHESVLPGS